MAIYSGQYFPAGGEVGFGGGILQVKSAFRTGPVTYSTSSASVYGSWCMTLKSMMRTKVLGSCRFGQIHDGVNSYKNIGFCIFNKKLPKPAPTIF